MSAVAKAGIREARVEIAPDGTISVIMGQGAKLPARRNSWDDILDK